MTKRSYGGGGIHARGKNSFRISYYVAGKRYAKTWRTRNKELRRLLSHSGDTGEHVAPDGGTLAGWAQSWIDIGCPGRNRTAVGNRSIKRYSELLRVHVLPILGDYKLQEIHSTDIDRLYISLEGKLHARTARQVHSVLNACLYCRGAREKTCDQPDRQIVAGSYQPRRTRSRRGAR